MSSIFVKFEVTTTSSNAMHDILPHGCVRAHIDMHIGVCLTAVACVFNQQVIGFQHADVNQGSVRIESVQGLQNC